MTCSSLTAEMCSQLIGDGSGDFALNRKDVGQLAIKGLCPEMRIIRGSDQLHIDAHVIICFLHATFEEIGDAELVRNLRKILRCVFITLR